MKYVIANEKDMYFNGFLNDSKKLYRFTKNIHMARHFDSLIETSTILEGMMVCDASKEDFVQLRINSYTKG